jgi:Flp pilus assembly protein TadD
MITQFNFPTTIRFGAGVIAELPAYLKKHDLKKAIQSAQRAVELTPDYPEANNTLGKLLMEDGRLAEARVPLERAAQNALSREAYKAWTNLGIIRYRLGDLAGAQKLMDRAIEEAPVVSCVAYFYRGQIKLQNNQLSSAILDYDRATRKVCASFSDAYLALGMAYEQNKQYELARKVFLDVEKRFPNTKIAEQAMDRVRFLP